MKKILVLVVMMFVIVGLTACTENNFNHREYDDLYIGVYIHREHWEVYEQAVYIVDMKTYVFEEKTYIRLYDLVDEENINIYTNEKYYVAVMSENVNNPFNIVSGTDKLFTNDRHKVNIYQYNQYLYVRIKDVPFLALDWQIDVEER